MNEEEFLGLSYEDFPSRAPSESAPPVLNVVPVQDVVMASVLPPHSECFEFFLGFIIVIDRIVIDTGLSTHPSMPALTTGTTAISSDVNNGWGNSSWGNAGSQGWSSPAAGWGSPTPQPNLWAARESIRGALLSVSRYLLDYFPIID
jgi:hypothetical protein